MPPVVASKQSAQSFSELETTTMLDDGRSARLVPSDAIGLLRSLPDASVDLVVTDPAYNGMNRHLSFGHGRIVGKYQQRGDGQRWFDEFDDSPENYAAFCAEGNGGPSWSPFAVGV